ncbi:hypothetical protein [Qipengyuania aquimaris]|uniref:Uncharacterized protein n=1 Tax=Qipengyuania aquimaris TaxID=255984 RepID=A0A9Q3S2H7_9SPHN|nr:hypothetical protein [Qipengyuania aquimaris]MBY6219020.1 hypothetical protein [Qipengyuania aquimaris]
MSLTIDNALEPWSGEWFIEPPRGLRLVNIHTHTAQQLLAHGSALTNWQARVLQGIAAQDGPLDSLQHYWLNRICNDVTGEEKAA